MLLHCLEIGLYRNGDGQLVDRAALSRLAEIQHQDPVTLVLPLRQCMVTELVVAAHEVRYLSRSLPWRFEEQLAAPVESLHFATGPLTKGEDKVHVSAVPRQWLQAVLDDLAIAGVLPQAAITESECLPWQEQAWTLWPEAAVGELSASCVLRYGAHQALLCSEQNLPLVLQTLADEQAALPRRILLCAEEAEAQRLQASMPLAMQGLVERQPRRKTVVLPEVLCNLLQGSFAPRLPWLRWWQHWRVAALLLLALGLADMVLNAADLWRLQSQNENLRVAIQQHAAAALPGAELADPLLQLRRAVTASGGGDHGGILALLTRMSPVFAANADIRVQSLEYSHDSGELQLVLESSGFTIVESLRASLQAQGLQAELLGSSSDGSRSRSRLRVKA